MKLKTWLFAESYRWKGILGGVVLAGVWILSDLRFPGFWDYLSKNLTDKLTDFVLYAASLPAAVILIWNREAPHPFSFVFSFAVAHGLILLSNLIRCFFFPESLSFLLFLSDLTALYLFLFLLLVAAEAIVIWGCFCLIRWFLQKKQEPRRCFHENE